MIHARQNGRRPVAVLAAAILIGLALPATAVAADPTTTEIREPTSPFGWYEPIHLLALVRPTPDEAGLVTLSRDGLAVATDLTSPNGAANFSLPGLTPGTYAFVAAFAGTADSLPSVSAPLQLVVVDDRTPITITVESGTNPSLRGDTVPFTVTVDPIPDTGLVTVYHDGQGTQEPLDPSGTNVIDHGFQNAGTFTVNACFGGSTVYQDTCTTVGVEQNVIAYDTTTAFTIDPLSLYVDEGLVIHVQVDPAPDTPASVIVRRMWEPTLWTIPLDPVTGIGELAVPGEDVAARLEFGENELIAQYGGSDHMNQSNSDTLIVFGKRDATTIDLDIDVDMIAPGGSVTATATVNPAPPAGTILNFYLRRTESNYVYWYGSTDDAGVATATLLSGTDWPVGDYATVEVRFSGTLRLEPGIATQPITIAYLDTVTPSFGFVLSDPDPSTSTRSIVVKSAVDGTGSPVVGAELSHDGVVWTAMPYAASLPWTLTAGDGLKQVWMRVTDAGGNVSGPGYFTIRLDTTQPTGAAVVANGAAFTAAATVNVSVAATDTGSGLSKVALSNDGVAWTTRPYAAIQSWTLPATDGSRTVYAKWQDKAGNWSAVKTDTIVLDAVAPTSSAPTRLLVAGTAISSGRIMARLGWSGADATSGIARYELQQSTDGGAWSTVSTTLQTPTLDRLLATGHRYQFRVRAVDKAGNAGTWMAGATAWLSRYNETNKLITYRGTWQQTYSSVFWSGGAKKSSKAGSTATFTYTGKSIAFVSRLGPTKGKAKVYLDGTLVATIDLYASTYRSQRVVWTRNFASIGKHTVTVNVAGTAHRPRIDVDAFVGGG
jgi:hypothetical protein